MRGSSGFICRVAVFWWAAMPAMAAGGDAFRDSLDLAGAWQQVSTADPALSEPPSGWKTVTAPGTLPGSGLGGAAYTWFRREVTIPAEWQGRRVYLHLAGARFDPHVFLDGKLLAERLEGWTPFEVELAAVQPGRVHSISVRCQDWSAAFKPGYVLPKTVTGDLRNAPQGQVIAPIGGHYSFYGIWDDVRLEARPQSWLDDVAIVPSVRKGALSVSGRVSGADSGFWVEASVVDAGATALSIPPAEVKNGAWSLESAFPGARYWSPEDPWLYRLRLTLRRGAAGAAADQLELRFGFREFWAEGPDLFLNGVKRRLRATSTWPASAPQTRADARAALETIKAGNNIAFRLHTQPWQKMWLEEADEVGLLIIEEGALWCDGGSYAYGDSRFWSNVRDHEAGMVRRDRNHPSLVMWSLENEILHCGGASRDANVEKNLAELGRFVKQLDPGHLITFEADLDPGGVADVIGLHYPHEMPDFSDYPNTADWLLNSSPAGAAADLPGSRKPAFAWERRKPLYIGEYLWIPYRDHSPGSVFFGDEVYLDREGFNLKAKAESWRHQTLGYRRAGVSGFCPWTSIDSGGKLDAASRILYDVQKEVYEPVAAFVREQDSRFFAGETVTRTFDVFNDSPVRRPLELRWSLEGAGISGIEKPALDAAAHQAVQIRIDLPRSAGSWNLAWSLTQEGDVLHRGQVQIRTFAKDVLRAPRFSPWTRRPVSWGRPPSVFKTKIFDPGGTWSARLGQEGLPFTAIADLTQAASFDSTNTILVIGPGALTAPKPASPLPSIGAGIAGSSALLTFLRNGGHLLVLEQETLEGFPLPVSLVSHASTMTFPAAQHPLLARLDASDLKFWRGDHYVTRREIVRPASSGGRAAVVSGGAASLDQAAIVEFPVSTGNVLLVQALVGEKLFTEPSARILFQAALDYLATLTMQAQLRAGATLLVTESDDFRKKLDRLGVAYRDIRRPLGAGDLADARVVLLHGGGTRIRDSAAALRDFLDQGPLQSTVYWHAPDAETFAALKPLIGQGNLELTASAGPVTVRPAEHPIFAGVLREDLAFGLPDASDPNWVRSFVPDPAVIDRAFFPASPSSDGLRFAAGQLTLTGRYVQLVAQGTQVAFYTEGSASFETSVGEAGLYSLAISAGGTPAGGAYPVVSIRVNGQQSAQLTVNARDIRSYGTLVQLPAGRVQVSVAFVNDAVAGTEDRNLFLEAVTLGLSPLRLSDTALLTLPPAVVAVNRGRGQWVLDGVAWDVNQQNRVKAERYATALLASLGAAFLPPEPAPSWVDGSFFELVGSSPYFGKTGSELAFRTNGTAQASFRCVKAGVYDLFIRGRSDPASGKYGIAELRVDGKKAGEVEVAGAGVSTWPLGASVELSEGEHTVSVAFSNDFYSPPEDRNLYINAVGFRIR